MNWRQIHGGSKTALNGDVVSILMTKQLLESWLIMDAVTCDMFMKRHELPDDATHFNRGKDDRIFTWRDNFIDYEHYE